MKEIHYTFNYTGTYVKDITIDIDVEMHCGELNRIDGNIPNMIECETKKGLFNEIKSICKNSYVKFVDLKNNERIIYCQ